MIQDDKLFRELFSDYQPELNSDVTFMESLNNRLDAVEYVKNIQETQIHRYKIAAILSLVCGIIIGGTFSFLVMLSPFDVPLFTFSTTNVLLLMLQQYSRLISIIIMSGMICWGIVVLVTMIQDVYSQKLKFA